MALKLNELTVTNAINGGVTGNAATATTASYATTAATALNVGNGTITIAAGTGVGVGSSNTFTTNQSGATTVTITNSGVTSLAGTTNRVTVSGATGAVTLNLPQDIHTGASPTFAGFTVAGSNATISRDLIVNGGTSGNFGNRIIVQGTATTYTYQDTTLRPTVYLNGDYPVVTLNATATTNANHGPTLQFAFNGLTTGGATSRQIVIGANGVGSWLDFGFSGGANGDNSSYNPHNGISGYNGTTTMRIFSNGVLIGSTGTYPSHITSTSYALDVRGTGYFSSTLQATRINFGDDNAQPWLVGAGGTAGTGLTFGGDYTSSQAYKIFTAMENVGGNYSKLTFNWHTGIRIGAYYGYGGTRFYNNLVGEGTEIFSVGNTDSNVRVVNSLIVNGITINQERANNARMYGAATGAFGLLGLDSAGSFRWQIYGDASSHGFLDSTWGNWDIKKTINGELDLRVSSALVRVLNAGNYQNYAPTLTGTGASGTWAINITGNAATATNGGVTSISAGTGIGTSASTGAVTITNGGVTSAVAGTGVGVSGATGAVTFSIGQAVGTANSPTFVTVTTSNDGANHIMAGSSNAEGIRMTPASSTTYPVFLRSVNPGVGEASPWIYKEQATDWGIWHNNPVNSVDFTKAGSGGIVSNVGGSANNTVVVRVDMGVGYVQTIAGYRNSAGTTILDNSGNITGNAATVTNGVYTGTNNTLTGINTINNTSNTVINTLSGNLGLTMYQATTGTDAYMTFHISGDYAAYFGLGGAENDLVYGGWSVGNVRYRILHSGNAPYAWNMNQYVRTTDSPTFAYLTIGSNLTIQKYNDRNLIIKGTGNSDAGILGRGASDQFAFQLYGDGVGNYGFLGSAWNTWDIRKANGGNLYLNDNSTYYLNPASTTNLLSLTVANTITGNINGYANYISAQTNPIGAFNVGLTRPKGASYTTTASSVTGAIKIKMPPGTPVHGMWKMTIKIYEYGARGNGYTIECGCHLYPSTAYNRYQYAIGVDANIALTIRYGTDGTSGCIWIGENATTWSYPQIHVTEFSNGFNNPGNPDWNAGTWGVTIGTIDNSVAVDGPYTISLPLASSATSATSATTAGSISGFNNPTTAVTANTIVYRDGGGDISTRYFLGSYVNSTDDTSSTGITYIMAKFGNDYHRSATAAKVATFISGQTMSIVGSSTSCTGNAATATALTSMNISQFTNNSGYLTSVTNISGNAATATTTDNINGRAFYNRDSGNVLGQDSYTNNGIGYVNAVSLFSQTDGGMYASAYSTSWIHQIYGDFRTGQIAVRGKNSGTWQAFRRVLDETNASYAWNMNQNVRTTDTCSFAGLTVSNTINGSVTGNAGGSSTSCTGNAATATTATSAGSINSDTGNVGENRLQYWQVSGNTTLNPDTEWYNAIRMGHGNPVTYYGNTLAIRMTGGNLGDIYTRTLTNGTQGSWNRFWHNNNDGAGSGLDADLVDGKGLATAGTADTIVLRDGSGHIYGQYILGSYFNASAGNSENPTIGQIWTQNTTDTYLRKSTPAHFRSQVTDGSYPSLTGANASGTWSINITGNAGTATSATSATTATTTTGNAGSVTYLPGRTDATAYPVLWGAAYTNAVGTIAYSCAAVNIQSSTGILSATSFSGAGTGLTGTAASLTAGAANSVAWTNVSGRPTAVSSFTNDSGYLTSVAIANGSVTLAKIENITAYTILGNSNASAAATPAALSVATVATMLSGQTMNINGSSTSCSGNAATATLATKASTLSQGGGNGTGMTFNWSGQGGQPTWLWGSNDGTNIYVWNPSNFNVNYATSAGSATSATNATTAGGLAVQSGTNYDANKIVRTDGNGYVNFGWINTISGDNGTTAIDRVYASHDGYIRYYTPANFRTVLDVPTRNGSGVTNFGINTAPSNRLHINGDGSNPTIRIDNTAFGSGTSSSRGFFGWLPISISGNTRYIQLYS